MKKNNKCFVKRSCTKAVLACILALSLPLSGCSAQYKSSDTASVKENYSYSSESDYSYDSAQTANVSATDEVYYEGGDVESYDAAMAENSDVSNVTFAEDRKIIYQSNVVMETMTYQETYTHLCDLIEKYGGRIEYESYDNQMRSFLRDNSGKGKLVISTNKLTVRVPSSNYAAFMRDGLSLGNVLSRNQSIIDKTSEYNTNKSYVDILNDEAEYLGKQLQVLENELKEAQAGDRHYDDIILNMKQIAQRKDQVEKELVPYKRTMDEIDDKVAMSTITIELREVNEYTKVVEPVVEEEPSFGDRISETWNSAIDSLVSMFQNIFLFLIDAIPVIVGLAIFGILFLIVWKIVRRKMRKNREKRENKPVQQIPYTNVIIEQNTQNAADNQNATNNQNPQNEQGNDK